jgi:tetratricopeptide (TPR) repeat protein
MSTTNNNTITIQDIDQLVQQKLNATSNRSNSLLRYFIYITIALFVSFILFTYIQSRRVDSLVSRLSSTISQEVSREMINDIPTETEQYIRNQLEYLEVRQTAILDETKNSLERMTFLFTTVAAFFGLFSLYFGYRQIMLDAKKDESAEQYDQEMRNLVRSFQENITTISSLISTLEQSYAYRKEIESKLGEITSRADVLEKARTEREAKYKLLIDSLNSESIRLFLLGLNRKSISAEENKLLIDNFKSRMENAEIEVDSSLTLNPLCYFMRGLGYMLRYQFRKAVVDFERAHQEAIKEQQKPTSQMYANIDRESIELILREAAARAHYFQGVCLRNIGQFKESLQAYKSCLQVTSDDFEAQTEQLQVMYFIKETSFLNIEKEFNRVQQILDRHLENNPNTTDQEFLDARKFIGLYRGNMYLKKKSHISGRSFHIQYEDSIKAIEIFREAYDDAKTSLTAFSLAQAYDTPGVSASEWKGTTPKKLYEEALRELSRRIVENNDAHFIITLHYMQAICATKANLDPLTYLNALRDKLKELPGDVLFFSPVSKVMISKSELLEELNNIKSY